MDVTPVWKMSSAITNWAITVLVGNCSALLDRDVAQLFESQIWCTANRFDSLVQQGIWLPWSYSWPTFSADSLCGVCTAGVGGLKMFTCAVHLLKNGCIASIKRRKKKKEKRCASLKVLILVSVFYIVGIWTMAVDVIVPLGCQTKDIICCCNWCLRDGCRLSTKNHGFLWLQVRCHERQRWRAAERVFCGCSEHNSTCNSVSHWHFHCHCMESFSHGQAEGKDMGAFSGKSDWLGSEYFDIATCQYIR